MKLSEELIYRGYVQDTTIKDLGMLDGEQLVFYHGYDASADSQTIGNLAAMMFDRLMVKHGHQAIILAGGATSLIGDPGGKDEERVLQNEEVIRQNIVNAEKQIERIFDGYKFRLVNNLDWTKDLNLLTFLRDVGKHFNMTALTQRDYIAKRIGGNGISYTEFSYTLLQGYDYLHLYEKYGCTLQIGGSDQWGNCLSGVDLIRKVHGEEVHAITQPLVINFATGKKFGKSEEGAVWLDELKTSVYKFYQFWINLDDEGIEGYLKIYTELEKAEIDDIMEQFNNNRGARLAQKTLAYEVTKLVHGDKRAEEVKKVSEVLFGQGAFLELDHHEKAILAQELGVVDFDGDLANLLVTGELASSKTEARNFIISGAISVNGHKISAVENDFFEDGYNLLKRGKNSFAVVKK